jgi:hypothetical protein
VTRFSPQIGTNIVELSTSTILHHFGVAIQLLRLRRLALCLRLRSLGPSKRPPNLERIPANDGDNTETKTRFFARLCERFLRLAIGIFFLLQIMKAAGSTC